MITLIKLKLAFGSFRRPTTRKSRKEVEGQTEQQFKTVENATVKTKVKAETHATEGFNFVLRK